MDYVSKGAIISKDEKYRYRLWREWRGNHKAENWTWIDKPGGYGEPKACVFIMLNPSTADATTDDPTIRRCVNFADRMGYERLEVVNLFAYRTSKPKDLFELQDPICPVGVENQYYIDKVVEKAGIIICAWGAHGGFLGQDETLRGWLDGSVLYALTFTKDGKPRHPLYLKNDCQPVIFK